MRTCAFLTLDDPTGFIIDDQLASIPLRDHGWRAEFVPWTRSAVDWAVYDAVVIRSTWDYAKRPEQFLATLRTIERSRTPLFNSIELVEWNLEKTYLRRLAELGVPTVPTKWCDQVRSAELRPILHNFGRVVVKPVIGAGAVGVFQLDEQAGSEKIAAIEAYYADRKAMIQPFLVNITAEGEFSLFYFNGRYSHAILKVPESGDFRVQEEHGGIISAVQPDAKLRTAGNAVLQSIDEPPLYARADFVRSNDGSQYWLIELELIEPSLYLRMDPESPRRFAEAIIERVVP